MSDGTETEQHMTDTSATAAGNETSQQSGEQGQQQEPTYTQVELDQMAAKIRGEERRKASEKFADYDALKTKAEGAKTLEDRLAEMEKRTQAADARALRSDIAAKYGIAAEDRDLFLTGADEETLEAQAKRLGEREVSTKKTGNIARREGTTKSTGTNTEAEAREFARNLFGGGD